MSKFDFPEIIAIWRCFNVESKNSEQEKRYI
jgi:hypothetical protein